MTRIITRQTWCPLCGKAMTEKHIMYGRINTKAIVCRPCKIFTFKFDPAFNKWRDSELKISCPHCQCTEVKWFLRYVDQYLKFVCPKCGIIGEGDCNALINTDGTMDLEVMDNSTQIPEESTIYVPKTKLKEFQKKKGRRP